MCATNSMPVCFCRLHVAEFVDTRAEARIAFFYLWLWLCDIVFCAVAVSDLPCKSNDNAMRSLRCVNKFTKRTHDVKRSTDNGNDVEHDHAQLARLIYNTRCVRR